MKTIRICCGTGCLANGSAKVAEEFERLTAGDGSVFVECDIKRTGCNGFCENGNPDSKRGNGEDYAAAAKASGQCPGDHWRCVAGGYLRKPNPRHKDRVIKTTAGWETFPNLR